MGPSLGAISAFPLDFSATLAPALRYEEGAKSAMRHQRGTCVCGWDATPTPMSPLSWCHPGWWVTVILPGRIWQRCQYPAGGHGGVFMCVWFVGPECTSGPRAASPVQHAPAAPHCPECGDSHSPFPGPATAQWEAHGKEDGDDAPSCLRCFGLSPRVGTPVPGPLCLSLPGPHVGCDLHPGLCPHAGPGSSCAQSGLGSGGSRGDVGQWGTGI